jgi:hypothetical protein
MALPRPPRDSAPPSSTSRLKKFAGSAALLIASITVSCLVGEFALRTFMKDRIVLFPRYQTSAQYGDFTLRRFRPNSTFHHTSIDGTWFFQTNSAGLRADVDRPYEHKPGVERIVALGDSHTAGHEVNQHETYAAVLEQELNQRGVPAEVFNAGISGFSTAEQLVYLEQEGLRYDPDVVVLAFYANDLEDNVKAGLFRAENGSLVLAKKAHVPGVREQDMLYQFALIRWLSENSYLYSFAFNTAYEAAKAALTRNANAEIQREYAIPVGEVSDYNYELARLLIEALYDLCQKHDVELIIMDIPVAMADGSIVSSIPPPLLDTFEQNSDVLVSVEQALGQLVHDGRLVHVPHGHRHINADAHRAYALELAEIITAN